MHTIDYDSLCIEVTRRCNMQCEHCLRGNAQNIDIDTQYIDRMLESASSIGELTFTGGEPTLNVPAMQYTLDYCKNHHIPIYGAFMATNGKYLTDDFFKFAVDLYAYVYDCNGCCMQEEYSQCCIALSQDMFHDEISSENYAKLHSLKAYSDIKNTDFTQTPLIARGRAENFTALRTVNPIAYEPKYEKLNGDRIQVEGTILLSSKGDIITDCDYDYKNEKRYRIGNVMHRPAEYLIKQKLNENI